MGQRDSNIEVNCRKVFLLIKTRGGCRLSQVSLDEILKILFIILSFSFITLSFLPKFVLDVKSKSSAEMRLFPLFFTWDRAWLCSSIIVQHQEVNRLRWQNVMKWKFGDNFSNFISYSTEIMSMTNFLHFQTTFSTLTQIW